MFHRTIKTFLKSHVFPTTNNTTPIVKNLVCFFSTVPFTRMGRDLENCKTTLYRMVRMESRSRDTTKIESYISDLIKKFPPSIHLYNILLNARILMNDANGMEDILNLIKSNNEAFNVITYNLLIGYYRNQRRPEEAERLAEQMQDANILWTRHTYTTLVTAFARKNIEKSRFYFEKMRTSSEPTQKPDIFSYNSMIGAYLDNGNIREAERLIEEMEKDGILPNFVTFKVLIEGLIKATKPEEAWQLYQEVKDNQEIRQQDLVDIFHWFYNSKENEKALEIFDEIEQRFNNVPAGAVCRVIYLSIIKSEEEKARQLINRYVKGHVNDYKTNLAGFITASRRVKLSSDLIKELEEIHTVDVPVGRELQTNH